MIFVKARGERPKRANKKRKYKEWEEDEVSEEEVFSEGDDKSGEEDDFEHEEIGIKITRLFAGSDQESFYGFEEDDENNDSNKENLLNLSNTDKSILFFFGGHIQCGGELIC